MAGANVSIDLNGDNKIVDVLQDMLDRSMNLEPAFNQIGEYLIESHQARFELEITPDGDLWEPLSPETLKAKTPENRILQDSGTLRDKLSYEISATSLNFGTNMEYGATHQFGREADGIPQREWLGLSTGQWNDETEILDILGDFLLDE
ncbi:phage virion morphogenesis protein [Catenovulum sediminis]|uniref:phage virion morphogenesis protein n=1 Tax=Catenovulum sediminis TaxID=1740262 RepID=UPI00117C30BB|nr:phage virion morphogenesis protein [Catenovulum sediminis]